MEKNIMIGIGALLVIGVAAWFFLGSSSFAGIDCGTDQVCFQEATQKCEPAKVTITQTQSGLTMTMYSEVQGGTPQACMIFLKIEDIDSGALGALGDALIGQFKGKDMTCTVDVTSGYDTAGGFQNIAEESCTGSLVDLIKNFAPTF